jgi:hypothetical protein
MGVLQQYNVLNKFHEHQPTGSKITGEQTQRAGGLISLPSSSSSSSFKEEEEKEEGRLRTEFSAHSCETISLWRVASELLCSILVLS